VDLQLRSFNIFGVHAPNLLFPPEEIFRLILYPIPGSIQSAQVMVRATDGTGALQDRAGTDTFPDGATGYNVVTVYVT
jgi:hypothetical protein